MTTDAYLGTGFAVPNISVEDGSCTQPLQSAATDSCSYHLPTPRLQSVDHDDHDEAVLHNASSVSDEKQQRGVLLYCMLSWQSASRLHLKLPALHELFFGSTHFLHPYQHPFLHRSARMFKFVLKYRNTSPDRLPRATCVSARR